MDGSQTILADYDFPVEVVPLVAEKRDTYGMITHNYPVPSSMQRAIVRTDTGAVLGTHGGAYKMVKHGDIVDRMQSAIDMSVISKDYTHTQEIYEGGAKMKGKIAFNDLVVEPQVGDYIRFQVEYLNSYDGMWSIMFKAQGYRLWCDNGCASPHALSYDRNKHTTGFNLAGTSAKIRNALTTFWDNKEVWQKYASMAVSPSEAEIFLKNTICSRHSNTTQTKVNETKLEKLMGLYNTESQKLGRNKWALYNALTYWSSHADDANHPHRAEVLRHNEVTKAISSARWEGVGKSLT